MYENRDIADDIDDICASIADIFDFTTDMTFATKHIPTSFREKHPDIPRNQMAGMRDVLIHDYMGVDLKTM